jgi:glycosyltransferase involved in cell wall biosynthesis
MIIVVHIIPPYVEFPPIKYGGTERVAYYLLKAQMKHYKALQTIFNDDHIVFTVFAKMNKHYIQEILNKAFSSMTLNFIHAVEQHPYAYVVKVINIIKTMLKSYKQKEKEIKIVIHNHVIQRNSFLLLHYSPIGKKSITTLHYDPPGYKLFNSLRLMQPKGMLIAISRNQYQRLKKFFGSSLYTFIHNGIPIDEFPFCKEKEDYFISLNAILPDKGVHNAIIFSKKTRIRLLLIGPVRNYRYFEVLRKYIDNKNIVYLGEVDEDTKRKLLCKAKALLFPVEREEFFGLNLVEAMACGTPVLAFNKGAVPEIVQHGVSGFLGSSIEELVKYVHQLDLLDPKTIRDYVSERFSSDVMMLRYASLYKVILEGNEDSTHGNLKVLTS